MIFLFRKCFLGTLIKDATLTEVLILNSQGSRVSVLTNLSGKTETNFGFTYEGGATVNTGCSLLWQNTYYMFGGYDNKYQIARLDDCQLTKIGDLSFSFYYGGCATVDDKVYICFDYDYGKNVCHSSSSPTGIFNSLTNSTYNHDGTKIAAVERK